jgi:heme A synthase
MHTATVITDTETLTMLGAPVKATGHRAVCTCDWAGEFYANEPEVPADWSRTEASTDAVVHESVYA